MRCKKPTVAVAVALFALVASPVRLAAQESQERKQGQMNEHDRYILIDMGTLGGPESGLFGPGSQVVNNRGTFVGEADTSIPHPYPNLKAPFGDPHPFIRHAFKWQDGVRTDLGALPAFQGGTGLSLTTWISDSGLIVGGSENGVIDPLTGFLGINAVLWNKKGQIIDLGTLGGLFGLAVAVNNQGQAVGYADNGIPDPFSMFGLGTQTRAFLWQDGVIQDLGTLGGPDAAALFVNERSQVAGQAFTDSTPNPDTGGMPTMAPFLWEGGKMTNLGTLGGAFGFPTALNNRGQVVGLSDLQGDQTFHPFLWHDGTLQDLGTLGGNYGSATGINDAGSVVGWATPPGDEVIHASLWRHGAITDLGTLTNDPCSFSFSHSINSRGQIVGVSSVCDAPEHPFLWENDEPMVDLNSLVVPVAEVTVTSPIFINDRGEIAAQGTLPNGDFRALLLIPCDGNHEGNHPDRQQCETVAKNTPPLIQGSSSLVTQTSSEEIQGRLTLEMLDALRTRSSGRYRRARARPQR